MCSLSYSTYKQEGPLTSDLFTKSEQLSLEESDGVYYSLCNTYHGVHSQTMLPGKDIYNFYNYLSNKNNVEENIDI